MKTGWTKEGYLKQRAEEHRESGIAEIGAMLRAASDAEALEAFGVQWTPEPEPWPEGIGYRVDADGEPHLILGSLGQFRRRQIYGEACRRWKGYGRLAEFVRSISAGYTGAVAPSVIKRALVLLRELGEEVPK